MNNEPLVVVEDHLMLFQPTLRSKILPLGVDTSKVSTLHIEDIDTSSLHFLQVLILVSTLHFSKMLLWLLTFGANTGIDISYSGILGLAIDI